MPRFKHLFHGNAAELRTALLEHFKREAAAATDNPRDQTDYEAGRAAGLRTAWDFLNNIVIEGQPE